MKKEDIEKFILWALIVLFGFIGLMVFAPYIGYVIIVLGISIPAYILYKKNKNEK